MTQPLQAVDLIAAKINMRHLSQELRQCYRCIKSFDVDLAKMTQAEYRLTREDHPVWLDIARMKLHTQNEVLESQVYGLKELERVYLADENLILHEEEWEEFTRMKRSLMANTSNSTKLAE